MFSCFFAPSPCSGTTAGGPAADVRRPHRAETGTFAVSYTCGLSFAATNARSKLWTQVFLLITGLLGLAFVGMELQEFIGLAARGIVPQRSGFLTSFFGLVGLHGLHVTIARWMLATMMAQVQLKGFRPEIVHRLICFNLFWHALDIVWIGIFTIVYLMGVGA